MNDMLNWHISDFDSLDVHLFHDVLKLRIDIFVVEQNCPYEELDDQDQGAIHVIGRDADGAVLAYARILDANEKRPPAIGRVVVDERLRAKGVGHALMERCLEYLEKEHGTRHSYLSAQTHLQQFYAVHGYETVSEEYDLDGIPHVDMILTPSGSN